MPSNQPVNQPILAAAQSLHQEARKWSSKVCARTSAHTTMHGSNGICTCHDPTHTYSHTHTHAREAMGHCTKRDTEPLHKTMSSASAATMEPSNQLRLPCFYNCRCITDMFGTRSCYCHTKVAVKRRTVGMGKFVVYAPQGKAGTGFTRPSLMFMIRLNALKEEPGAPWHCYQSLIAWPTCEAKDDSFPKTSG